MSSEQDFHKYGEGTAVGVDGGHTQEAPNSNQRFPGLQRRGLAATQRQSETATNSGRLLGLHGERLVRRQIPLRGNLVYAQDIFLTLVQWKWPYTILAVCAAYCLSWALFAALWFALNANNPECLSLSQPNTTSFNTMFIFSIMVQTTIGFGNDFIYGDCQEGSLLLVVQCVIGLLLDGVLLGLVLTKASRAKSRACSIVFSRYGVVCRRNGVLCLLWRLADLRVRSVCEAHIRAYLYKSQRTREGESLDWECRDLDLGYDTGRDRVLMLLPITACHYITESSPFHGMTQEQIMSEPFEIVLLLEGVIEATGLTAQARASYTHRDILWGHRFAPIVRTDESGVVVDFEKISSTEKIDVNVMAQT